MKPIKLFSFLALACFSLMANAQKYVGGDISLLPSYEKQGALYLDSAGNTIAQPLSFFHEQGMNAMRVRLFVDPSKASDEAKDQGVVQDLDYVKALAKRIKAQGMALLLDFHYSDTWADPANQWTPDAWKALSTDELNTRIYTYTKEALQQLVAEGATPDFIQTGNEISYGMLWGVNGASGLKKCYTNSETNWDYFTKLLKQAGKACREVCPEAKIVIHTERVPQVDVLKGIYEKMDNYQVDYDIIGVSYYPFWHGNIPQLEKAVTTLHAAHADKQIMVVETGYYHDWQPDVTYDLSATYPINAEGQKAFTVDLIKMLNKYSYVTGLFWWWMEANEKGLDWSTNRVTHDWNNYGLFDNQTGRAMPALYKLKDFLSTADGISKPQVSKTNSNWYTLQGVALAGKPQTSGIYVNNGNKVAIGK